MKSILALIILCALTFQLEAQISFPLSSTLTVGAGPDSVAAADVNGDGKVDLISANYNNNTLTVLTNNGSGGFVLSSTISGVVEPSFICAADVNGDGKVDLISANYGNKTLTVLTNDGSGGFVLSATLSVGVEPTCVIAADVNGDGKLDLICVNSEAATLSVLTNNGSGGFVLSATLAVGTGAYSVCAADVNGDGKPDLICANAGVDYGGSTVTEWMNNGSGGFVFSATFTAGAGPYSVVAADVNGDGKLDLICANDGGGTLTVLTNDGSGVFATSSTLNVGNKPVSVVTADVNLDGKVDLICANYGSSTLTVLTNNGSGGFVTSSTLSVGNNPFRVVAADVNGDGKVDLISANYGGNTLTVLTNATPFPMPVTITTQPTSITVPESASAMFTVAASGYPPPIYQWALNGTNLIGATSNTLTIGDVEFTNLGYYQVLISNYFSFTNSYLAALNMSPSLASPFGGATTIWGQGAILSVGAIGSGQLSYQWYQDGVAIGGATGSTLNFPSIQFTNGGLYSVVVTSPYGSITNVGAQVIVNPAGVSLGLFPGVIINGTVGYNYTIQSTTNLKDTNAWVTVTNLTLTDPVQLWVDTNLDASLPLNPASFYRVLPGQ